jgi:hypothetical protein
MRRRPLVRHSIAIATLAAWMTTCGDPQTRTPLAPSPPFGSVVELSGPASIAPGQSAQFSMLLHLPDGSTKIATSVTWSSTNASLLQVAPSGIARAGSQKGDVTLSAFASFNGSPARGAREVVVVPDGTYRLVGTVNDAQFPTLPVTGARLDVTPGSLSAITDSSGNYELLGVLPDASIHVAGDGYLPVDANIHLTGNTARSFQLTPSAPRLNLAGNYTLAIDAAPGCSGSGTLTTDLQHRSYQAVVTQTAVDLQVTLAGASFQLDASGRGNKFTGKAGITGATFTLDNFTFYYYYYLPNKTYPSLVERLSNGTVLVIAGTAVITGTPAGLSGTLDGGFANYTATPIGKFLGGCSSTSNQFTLTPR